MTPMLRLSPQQMDLLARVARERFVQRAGRYFATLWPAMVERLGDRFGAFIDLAVQHAQKHGLAEGPCVARYVNLWFVWGPAFEDKPGFEWARDILADPRRSEFTKPHQLVRRTLDELERQQAARGSRPGQAGGLSPSDFNAADERVVRDLADLGRLGDVVPSRRDVPRLSCDIEAIDIGTIACEWRHEYRCTERDWARVPVAPLPRLRIDDPATPAPGALTVLSHAEGQGEPARLQVKLRSVAVCDVDTHPRVAFGGEHGLWEWRGHEATAVSWPVQAPPNPPLPPADAARLTGIATEWPPRIHTLALSSCGLRDHGAPLGEVSTHVLSYPADQWLLEWRHAARPAATWPDTAARPAPPSAACRLERDGIAQDARGWQAGFAALHEAFDAAMDQLLLAWERTSGAAQARLDAEPALFTGQAGLTWGWREGPRGLAESPLMRLEGWLDCIACGLDLQLSGEIALGGSRARVRLHAKGSTPLRTRVQRDRAEPPWPEALANAKVAFRYPFELDVDPLAVPELAAFYPVAPLSGALVGEAGLRPRLGGSGVQWFLTLRVEPVSTTVLIHDPILGDKLEPRPLLPALTLLDWSLG